MSLPYYYQGKESRGTGDHHIKINKTNTAFFSSEMGSRF